jgi:outer membrane protein
MDLIKPIMEKAQAAIKKVAKEKGFNYVLDSTIGNGVLVADGTDILADVKKSLGF